MSGYIDYKTAYDLMKKGHIASVHDGKYDFYVVGDDKLYGCYKMDELYPVDLAEESKILLGKWYIIS